jgi:hypothetical protein
MRVGCFSKNPKKSVGSSPFSGMLLLSPSQEKRGAKVLVQKICLQSGQAWLW